MSETVRKVWFITGTSTGFGRAMAEQLLRRGDRVVATARKVGQIADFAASYPETALALSLDVTDQAAVEAAVAAALARFGQVDVLVNNAGYGIAGAIEEVTPAEFHPVFDVNVFGLIRVTQALLPHLRARKSGHIVNLSSIAGLDSSPGLGYYNAAKYAVEGLSEALAKELAPLGIGVTIVEPGPFRTDFLGRSGVLAERRIADYDATAGTTRNYFVEQAGRQPGDPVRGVAAMIAAIESPRPPLRLLLGAIALRRLKAKMAGLEAEVAAWESVTLGADFPEVR